MKQIIFFFAMMLCGICSLAQPIKEHLVFKGVPIDGTLIEYVSKMESAGFTYLGSKGGTAFLQGDFAGLKGCIISVSTLNDPDVVNTIGVIFPEKNDWSSLEDNYQKLKEMLTEKYGKPSECIEKFQGYAPKDNHDKLHSLKMDRCTYTTIFKTPKGDIRLSLEHQDIKSFFVKLQYWDKINTDAVKAKAMDDL